MKFVRLSDVRFRVRPSRLVLGALPLGHLDIERRELGERRISDRLSLVVAQPPDHGRIRQPAGFYGPAAIALMDGCAMYLKRHETSRDGLEASEQDP
jgi:hypothetical protein